MFLLLLVSLILSAAVQSAMLALLAREGRGTGLVPSCSIGIEPYGKQHQDVLNILLLPCDRSSIDRWIRINT
jgi:hypothetical protein